MKSQNQKVRTHIIINPVSAAGKTGRKWDSYLAIIENRLGKTYSIHFTRSPLDTTNSARQAIKNGCELVIAVGGDGTINEIVNGFFECGKIINQDCALGIINSGTGQGFAQSTGLNSGIHHQVDVIFGGSFKKIDIGKIEFRNPDEEAADRYFINECQIGIGGNVVKNVTAKYKRFGGKIGFGLIAFSTALSNKSKQFTLKINGNPEISASLHGLVVGNGSFMGGGMMLTPGAETDDGALDLLSIREQSVLRRIINFSKVRSGRHVESAGFGYQRCTSLLIISPDDALIAADGELIGTTPCSVGIIPQALRVCSQNRDNLS